MRVLFVSNTAGSLTPVIEWLNKNGHEARVVQRETNISKSPEGAIVTESPKQFYRAIISQIRVLKPDVIHVNSRLRGLIVARLAAPKVPIVLMWHGSEIRGKRDPPVVSLADEVLVSTPDLSKHGHFFGVPVDPIFYYRGGRVKGTALMLYADHYPKDQRELAKEWSKTNDHKLSIYHWKRDGVIPHSGMPLFLSGFHTYLDFKGLKALSLTGLEALYCGCRVIHDNFGEITHIPNLPEPRDFLSFYQVLEPNSRWNSLKRVFSALRFWRYGDVPKEIE